MGLIVSKSGLGRDIYEVMTMRFCKVKGGIGMATVGANAVFMGALPFAFVMLIVLFILIEFPILSLALI